MKPELKAILLDEELSGELASFAEVKRRKDLMQPLIDELRLLQQNLDSSDLGTSIMIRASSVPDDFWKKVDKFIEGASSQTMYLLRRNVQELTKNNEDLNFQEILNLMLRDFRVRMVNKILTNNPVCPILDEDETEV